MLKIETDYDLFDLISGAKTGMQHKRIVKKIVGYSIATSMINLPFEMMAEQPGKEIMISTLYFFCCNSMGFPAAYYMLRDNTKKYSKEDLEKIVRQLSSFDVCVGYESLLKAYKYDKEYETIKSESAIPKILEKKYIMVPCSNDVSDGVSLVQEHIVGSKKYTLSVGEVQKTYKLVKSPGTA